jgi:hypothetical protein
MAVKEDIKQKNFFSSVIIFLISVLTTLVSIFVGIQEKACVRIKCSVAEPEQ